MNTSQLHAFLTSAEEKSFSAAARRLFVSPSALFQQIAKLEQDVGFPLFYRNHSGIELTEAGIEFYHAVKQSAILIDQAKKNGLAIAKGRRILRLALQDSSYGKALKAFALDNPDVLIRHVDVPLDDMAEILTRIENHQLDLCEGEWVEEVTKRGLCFHPTAETRLCAVVSYRHPLAERSFVRLEELANADTVFYKSLFGAGELIRAEILRTFQVINTRYSYTEVMNAVESGKAYIMEEDYVEQMCPFGVAVPISPDIIVPYGFIHRKNDALADSFLAYFKEMKNGLRKSVRKNSITESEQEADA